MSLAWAAYRVLAPCLGALAPAARRFAPAAERPLWRERLGLVGLEGGCHAWLHSASMGEALAVGPLVGELRKLEPDARLYLTATTRTGRARLETLGLPTSLAPIDSPQAVRRFFTGVRPERLIVVETELWPHWLLQARAEGVPAAVVSARLSERSVRRYFGLGRVFRSLVSGLGAVLCQSLEDERRWLAIGAPEARTAVVGNLKDEALPRPAASRSSARSTLGLDPERPLLVLGSLRAGEARVLARAWKALPSSVRDLWQVAAVPRHARTSRELIREVRDEGLAAVSEGPPAPRAWRWDESPGVLARYYAAADVAFVGGSLGPYGGHNPLEPAACGAAVVTGGNHQSQADGVEALRRGGGVWVADSASELYRALLTLLSDGGERAARGRAARAIAEARRGAAQRAVARLAEWGLWPAA